MSQEASASRPSPRTIRSCSFASSCRPIWSKEFAKALRKNAGPASEPRRVGSILSAALQGLDGRGVILQFDPEQTEDRRSSCFPTGNFGEHGGALGRVVVPLEPDVELGRRMQKFAVPRLDFTPFGQDPRRLHLPIIAEQAVGQEEVVVSFHLGLAEPTVDRRGQVGTPLTAERTGEQAKCLAIVGFVFQDFPRPDRRLVPSAAVVFSSNRVRSRRETKRHAQNAPPATSKATTAMLPQSRARVPTFFIAGPSRLWLIPMPRHLLRRRKARQVRTAGSTSGSSLGEWSSPSFFEEDGGIVPNPP